MKLAKFISVVIVFGFLANQAMAMTSTTKPPVQKPSCPKVLECTLK